MTTVDNPKVSQTSGKDEDPKEKGFFNRPRAGGKTMWDWLNLLGILAIPLVVVGATLLFGIQQANLANQQHENDQKQALDQQRAAILQTYIDNIQDLLLNHNLLKSKPDDDVAILARARTLTALQGLDSVRKGRLLIFLHEAELIGFLIGFQDNTRKVHAAIINLSDANLSDANLSGANLHGAELHDASLNSAILTGAILIEANLNGAALTQANLSNANLSGADLTGTSLYQADFTSAILIGVKNLIQAELNFVYSCTNASLPSGLTCNQNP